MAVSINRPSQRSGIRRRSTGSAFSDINVTPFVDVMLVLLVIFMVTAPMLTVGVPVDLPKTKAARMNDQIEPLVVSVDANGRSYLQETELDGDVLIERLIAVSGGNPDAKIYVRGDQKINYGRVMEIMGIIAAAGFNRVSLIAEMPSGAAKGTNLTVGKVAPDFAAPPPGQFMPQAPYGAFPQGVPQGRAPQFVQSPGMQPAPVAQQNIKSSGALRTPAARKIKLISNPVGKTKTARGQ